MQGQPSPNGSGFAGKEAPEAEHSKTFQQSDSQTDDRGLFLPSPYMMIVEQRVQKQQRAATGRRADTKAARLDAAEVGRSTSAANGPRPHLSQLPSGTFERPRQTQKSEQTATTEKGPIESKPVAPTPVPPPLPDQSRNLLELDTKIVRRCKATEVLDRFIQGVSSCATLPKPDGLESARPPVFEVPTKRKHAKVASQPDLRPGSEARLERKSTLSLSGPARVLRALRALRLRLGTSHGPNAAFEAAASALSIAPAARTEHDLEKLRSFFLGDQLMLPPEFLKFGDEAVNYFLRLLRLRELRPGESVFDYGDRGREFFIVMRGQVAVLVPLRVTISLRCTDAGGKQSDTDTFCSAEQGSESDFKSASLGTARSIPSASSRSNRLSETDLAMEAVAYAIQHYPNIAWEAMAAEFSRSQRLPRRSSRPGSASGRWQTLADELAQGEDEDQNQVAQCPIAWELHDFMEENPRLIELRGRSLIAAIKTIASRKKRNFTLPFSLLRFLRGPGEPKQGQEHVLKLKMFAVVKTLGPGECFGELALVNSGRRAARVTCTANCTFGVLERRDYSKVLGSQMRQELNQKVLFLR